MTRSPPYTIRGRTYECEDCSWAGDSPMLHDKLWLTIARKDELLCTGCVEKRLGRHLQPDDLRVCPMNSSTLYMMHRIELLIDERADREKMVREAQDALLNILPAGVRAGRYPRLEPIDYGKV